MKLCLNTILRLTHRFVLRAITDTLAYYILCGGCRSCVYVIFLLMFSGVFVPEGSPSRGGDVKVYVLHINQPSLPTLSILFLCLCLSLWPFQLHFIPWTLPTTVCFFSLFFRSFLFCFALLVLSTIHLFMKVSPSPDIILCGWLGLKHQLTD